MAYSSVQAFSSDPILLIIIISTHLGVSLFALNLLILQLVEDCVQMACAS